MITMNEPRQIGVSFWPAMSLVVAGWTPESTFASLPITADPIISGLCQGDSGTTPGCVVRLPFGSTHTFTAMPVQGYDFTGWSGNCSGMATCTIIVNQPDLMIRASYVRRMTTLTLDVGAGGTVRATPLDTGLAKGCTGGTTGRHCVIEFPEGTRIQLLAEPVSGDFEPVWEDGVESRTRGVEIMTASKSHSVVFLVDFTLYSIIVSDGVFERFLRKSLRHWRTRRLLFLIRRQARAERPPLRP